MILVEERHLEAAERGEMDLELIALDYTGPRHSMATESLRTQAYWPGTTPVLPSVTYVALVPDDGLAFLESKGDIRVSYDPADIAQALLQRNYLPPNVFGREFDARVQDRVLETLGMEFRGILNEEGNREELRKIADVDDVADDEPEEGPDPRVKELTEEYSRGELKDAAKELRENPDDISLKSGKTEFADWLAEQDQSAVHDALDDDEEE